MLENVLFIITAFAVAYLLGRLLDAIFELYFGDKPLTVGKMFPHIAPPRSSQQQDNLPSSNTSPK